MKCKIAIAILLMVNFAFGQQLAPTPVQLFGQNPPDTGKCADPTNVASTYTQVEDPANGYTGQYLCLPSGPNSFAWSAVAFLPPGTNGTTGTVLIANGKTLRVANSLRLSGTDNATTYLPTVSAGVPALTFCGATSGNATCANTNSGVTARVIGGIATLSSNSAVVSGINPPFSSTSTFSCTSNDTTTVGNPTKVVNTSASSITITNTTGASDVVAWHCLGY